MDPNSNCLMIEISFRLRMNYKLVIGIKRTWLVATLLGVIQTVVWLLKGHS